jgi:hypothetical protein
MRNSDDKQCREAQRGPHREHRDVAACARAVEESRCLRSRFAPAPGGNLFGLAMDYEVYLVSRMFGVLADAFVVRMTLVPAAMALLGRRAWWMPKRLDRIVPDVDIEGEAVMKGLHGAAS